MLGIDERTHLERQILGVFIIKPQIGKSKCNLLSNEHFTDEYRRMLFSQIVAEANKGKVIVPASWDPDIVMETEMNQCIKEASIDNLDVNIKELRIDQSYVDLWRMSEKVQDMTINDKKLEDIVNYIETNLYRVKEVEEDEHRMSIQDAIEKIESGEISYKEYPIGWDDFDEFIPFSSQNITIIGGLEGSFKTKLMIYLMRLLLTKHDNVAVLWYSMEDPVDKIIRGFISQDTLLRDKELRRMNYADMIPKVVNKFNIQFRTKSASIKEIGVDFQLFKKENKDKFCILIVDNIMKIHPDKGIREENLDISIVREIESWNIKTSQEEASVILLHHLTKSAKNYRNEMKGYEPNIEDMRGSGRYKDFATNVILVNAMYSHPDIINLFRKNYGLYKEFIHRVYKFHILKNRNELKTTFTMLVYPEYNHFYQIK